MFSTPLRLLASLRPNVPTAVMLATAVSTIVFSATPFLIHPLATQWHASPGLVGLISTVQLAGFVMASSIVPRFVNPRRTVMTVASLMGFVANLASAFAPDVSTLLPLRLISGISLGLIAWVSWAEVFGDDARVGDMAVIGPVVGTVASPLIAMVIDVGSPQGLFAVLAVLNLLPLPFVRRMRLRTSMRDPSERHRPTRAAFAILVALGLFTTGGSAIFIYAADIGERFVGLSAVAVSFAFAINALAAVPAARFRGKRVLPGFWMLGCVACAATLGMIHNSVALFVAMAGWGFFFWRGIPGAFAILAQRSVYPEERAGDAQAVMAAGRVIGPLIGGAVYTTGPVSLGLVSATIMLIAALIMVWVEWRVHPTQLRSRFATSQ